MQDSSGDDKKNNTKKSLTFFGKGSNYLGIWVVNISLTILTLGLYYPWAVASIRKFIWAETELENNRFVFHGTGKEMFKGFIKVYLIVLVIFGIEFYGGISNNVLLSIIGYFLTSSIVFILVPLAIFGAVRYRLSRTSWRGIFFSFKGNLMAFLMLYMENMLYTILTFSIYTPWMQNNIRKYIISHVKFGNLRMGFDGKGLQYFSILFSGFLLTILSVGIYFPWYAKNIFNFHINNMYLLDENGNKHYLHSNLTGSKSFGIMFTNLLLGILSFGLAFAWIFIRTTKMYINNIEMPDGIDFSNVFQDADDYKDATGDDLADVLDIGIDF
jgi:uncharacterized membrane protein YjgN (DUF898 family)